MFGSAVLDTAIGMVLLFFVVSTACSNVFTIWARVFNTRGRLLQAGLDKLLGTDLYEQIMEHPLIKNNSLELKRFSIKSVMGVDIEYKTLPSYINPRDFANILAEICDQAAKVQDFTKVLPGEVHDPIRYFVEQLRDGEETVEKLVFDIEDWYKQRMGILTEIFRNQSQIFIMFVAIIVTVIFNINSITVAQALWEGPTLRDAVVQAAGAQVQQDQLTPQEGETLEGIEGPVTLIKENLQETLELPLGWTSAELTRFGMPDDLANDLAVADNATRDTPNLLTMFIGWMITVGAAMFGAPFWFDFLRKIVSFRSDNK